MVTFDPAPMPRQKRPGAASASAAAPTAMIAGPRVNAPTIAVPFVAPLGGEAQAPGKVWRIGFLGTTSPRSHGAFLDAFRTGLRERGYVDGKTVTMEIRWAESDYARLPALAAELVSLNVDLILTHGTPGSQAAKAATSSIPIVTAVVGDPVATGLVQTLARPGGNLTGSAF